MIGRNDHFYGRDRNGEWTEFRRADPTLGISITDMTTVSDPKMLRELEDTRALRIQREAVATLDMISPAPPMEQSLAQCRQFDAQAQAQQQAMENQARQAVQPLAMHHSWPVMRL